jgi:protoporphyrinogen oxidase
LKNDRVAIIGGGMSGLSLAYFLGLEGFRVSVIERGAELSGLLAFTNVEGVPVERFYHHFFTHDAYLLGLIGELGLSDRILWQNSASAVFRDGALFPFVTKADYLRLPFLSIGAKVRSAAAAAVLRFQKAENLPPELTAESYLRKLFGLEGWENMWRPLLVNKFGEGDSHKISAQWIAKRIQIRSRSERRGREVLGYFNGSYRVLFDRLREVIVAQGGTIVLNCEVTELPRTRSGRYRIDNEEYDVVVSTIAPHLIQRIVPQIEIPKVSYRGAIVPLFILRSSVTPYYWINILDAKVPFSVIVNKQSLLPKGYYRGRYPLYIGHYVPDTSELFAKNDEELFKYYISYLRKIFPGIDGEIAGYEVSKTKFAQPVVTAPWKPLQHTTNIPNLYTTSMAHIFPEDRGANYAIREARRITALLVDGYGDGESVRVREMHGR